MGDHIGKKEDIEVLWQINKNLEEISIKIDQLISLYRFVQEHELECFREKVLGKSKIRREIYGMCDGTKTVQEIARRANRSIQHVSMILKTLERGRLIESREVGKKKYYIRIA
ncbi:MAG: winged helix-turn-helix transcriptional regulator [Theionarchaea archaeon]|nr:winged helix-turn-helix transcriptional regulator [Theionarchaea archaeon]